MNRNNSRDFCRFIPISPTVILLNTSSLPLSYSLLFGQEAHYFSVRQFLKKFPPKNTYFGHYFSVTTSLLFGKANAVEKISKNIRSHYFSVTTSLLFGHRNTHVLLKIKDLTEERRDAKVYYYIQGRRDGEKCFNFNIICILLAEFFSLLLSFCGKPKNTPFLPLEIAIFRSKVTLFDPFFVIFNRCQKNDAEKLKKICSFLTPKNSLFNNEN